MINLQKGQRIEIGLSKVGVGLGWDPNQSTGYDFDLDASAFMLGSNGKLPLDEFFVFYNNPKSPDGAVESSGDDTSGGNSDGGDDETLTVDLSKVDPRIQEILFTVTIHEAETRKQNFGQVHNSYIRIYNATNDEVIAKVKEIKPDVLGLSALLTTTMEEQGAVIKMLEAEGLRDSVKVIIGGAPVNQDWADKVGADGYSGDAIAATKLVKELLA